MAIRAVAAVVLRVQQIVVALVDLLAQIAGLVQAAGLDFVPERVGQRLGAHQLQKPSVRVRFAQLAAQLFVQNLWRVDLVEAGQVHKLDLAAQQLTQKRLVKRVDQMRDHLAAHYVDGVNSDRKGLLQVKHKFFGVDGTEFF